MKPTPIAKNRGQVQYIGDFMTGQTIVLGQFLWVEKTDESRLIWLFEAIYKGSNNDHYWDLCAHPIPPQEGTLN